MRVHDFNLQGNVADIEHVDGEKIRITRGELPNGVHPTEYERAFYIPEEAGVVTVTHNHFYWKATAPLVVVHAWATAIRIDVDGSPENVYSLEAIALKQDEPILKHESAPGIYINYDPFAVAMYTRENRFFTTADGQKKESGWYVHSLKVHPSGIHNVIGVSDVKWESGVRDNEMVHYHRDSLEPLVVLEGAAIMLVEVDGKYYSFRQEKGVLTIPDKGQVHGILQVEGPYRHMCAQGPSKFHDPTDRVVVKGEGFPNGKTREYVERFGIPPAL